MKEYLRYFFAPLIFIIISGSAAAQTAPVITYTPATNVYTINSTITTLTPANSGGAVTANSLTTFSTDPGGGQPYGIAYDPTTGDIITDNFAAGAVYRYSPSGVLLNTYTTSIFAGGPKDIVVDNSGNIFVANGLGGNIVKITPSGTTTTISATGTAFNQPDGMTINRTTGVIYIADQGTNDVYSIASGATVATVYKSGFTNAYGVTVNAATGVVYVSEYTPSADIKQIAPGGGTVTTFISKAAGGFSDLRNLDIDAAGNLFVANYGNNSIDEFSPTGVFIAHVVTGLSNPRATAEDVFGNLYIANSGGGNVKEYSTAYYSINIPLPAGMSFNTTTGQISGTPTVTSPTTVYTVVGHNASGSGYTTVTITVDPTGPTASGVNLCGAGTATLTATAGAPAGGTFNWYAASSGGSALATGATYSPLVSTTTIFYVDYVQGGVTCAARTAVTVTVGANPIISTAPTSGAYFSYGFTAGSLTDIAGVNTGVQHGAPTTTLDRYNTSGNAYNFVSASTQYISTTTSYTTPGPATFSISAWFKTSTAGGYIAGFGSSQTGSSVSVDRVIYIGTDGKLYFGVAPSGVKKTINTVATYNDGVWHHVVATFSAVNGSNMYVDGALAASDPTMNAAFATAGYWRVGYDDLTGWTSAPTAANTYFNGALDDIAAANTELTPAQVNVLYGAGSNSTFCAGNALALTANTVASATYSWVGPSGSGFTSTSQNPTVPAANAIAGIYVLTVTSATGCTSVINVTAPSNVITYTWSGAAGTTNPLTAGNWDRLPLFTNTTNLVIPTGLAKYPVLTANETIYGLTLASGATFSLGGFTLSMGCNIYNSSGGQILYGANNASGITWNGSLAAQYYYGTNTANTAQVGTMTVNNSAAGTINISGGPLDIYSLLTMTKGMIIVGASPAALTLKSSATQTAGVAVIPSACSITGNVNVERYIQGASVSTPGIQKRGYRLISSAVYTGTVGGVKVFDLKYLTNNLYVSGLNGATNGFFPTPLNNPTLYLFREDSKPPPSKTTSFTTQYNWKGIANINNANAYDIGVPFRNNYTSNAADTTTNIPVGNGVLMYFRGDNSTTSNGTTAGTKFTTPFNYPESATTTQVGTLNTGTINVKMWFANAANNLGYNFSYTPAYVGTTTWLNGGYACVGNPYASTINWEKYNRNGANSSIYGAVSTIIYMFNEANRQYESYMQSTATTFTVADTTTAINPGTSQGGTASNMIASGQGFFVIASGPGQTLSFRETAKTSTQPSAAALPNLMSKGAPKEFAKVPEPLLRLKLFSDNIQTDEIVVRMNNQSSNKYVLNEDALDLGGNGALVSLSAYSSDSTQLSIDYRPYPGKQPMLIPLMVDAGSSGTYKLANTQLDNLPVLYDAWLIDYFKNDSLKLKSDVSYTFIIDKSNPATFGSNRFSVVIRQNPAYVYQLLDFNASKVANTIQVQTVWKTANEANYTRFTVERSIDNGKTFDVIGGFTGTGAGTYSLADKSPVYGQNLYRLKQEDINDSISYSNIIPVLYSNLNNSNARVQVYPNPAKSGINVSILADANTPCTIRISNSTGLIIKQATGVMSSWQTNVSDLLPGTYIVRVFNGKDSSLVGDTKFVKL
jgi:hypothetical protein